MLHHHYAAIEGKLLAIVWLLEHMKYFTKGCKDLMVLKDHKILVAIFGDHALNKI